ncbi:hypothetical protein ACM28_03025 [Helicobacter pylori]|nr:hypothetical protein ACM28_03025 [Helicobacter pylori]
MLLLISLLISSMDFFLQIIQIVKVCIEIIQYLLCENFRAVIIQRARSYFLTIKHFSITLISVFQNLQKTLSQIALKTDLKKI